MVAVIEAGAIATIKAERRAAEAEVGLIPHGLVQDIGTVAFGDDLTVCPIDVKRGVRPLT